MQAVILAAGDGDRLAPHTREIPKPLLPLRGRPIINRVLDGLFAAGVRDAVVVIGYRGELIRHALDQRSPSAMRIRFAQNEQYERGNARSLWSAHGAIDGPFVLAMADHLVEPALTGALVAGANGRCRLATERAPRDDPRGAEATRAYVRDGRVVDLGKALADWNALDTGSFWCTPDVFDAVNEPALRDGELASVFASLARAGQLDAVDVTGRRWIDIDTPGDLRAANAMLGADGRFA